MSALSETITPGVRVRLVKGPAITGVVILREAGEFAGRVTVAWDDGQVTSANKHALEAAPAGHRCPCGLNCKLPNV